MRDPEFLNYDSKLRMPCGKTHIRTFFSAAYSRKKDMLIFFLQTVVFLRSTNCLLRSYGLFYGLPTADCGLQKEKPNHRVRTAILDFFTFKPSEVVSLAVQDRRSTQILL